MLRFLRVAHLATIDSVEVEFDAGLNVLTGETGAGKSILVGAVGLLLGGRASAELVRTGESAATIEAVFETGESEVLIRREITAQGRSRAFVNGELATAAALKELAAELIELHGQHEHQTLLDPSAHIGVLDAYGQLEPLLVPVRTAYESVRAIGERLARLKRAVAARDERLDLVRFQLGELESADLKPMPAAADGLAEDDELAAARQVLANAERVERLCQESYASLYENDSAILSSLGQVWRRVSELATLDPRFQPYVEARTGIKFQLEDLAAFLRRYADSIEASPAALQKVEERLALLERLKRKYGPTLADVVARREALRTELDELQNGDDRIVRVEREFEAARDQYVQAAAALRQSRRQIAVPFARELERLLADLAMDRTRFDVRFADTRDGIPPEAAWTAAGFDAAEFYVSPNPGEELRPLARIVSGGELSRIMLAIKTLTFGARLGGARQLEKAPGLIFDEVDAGIGGRVADVVGRKLQALGSAFQVLCITHLPQIVAHADAHYQIDKQVEKGRTWTTVRRLDGDGRVDELARMLGGAAMTEGLRASAREMLLERRLSGKAKGEAKGKGESERSKAKVSKRS